ncbi:hypothetical protein [Deinococcus phoenicis]|uniref:hypothetical protein n=1 Tax=Deinococcus phoenicis TaxID=1476583 RepID=UPI001268ED8D|nr:hypothetical protein [Deinococcus phoenicis]
MKRRTRLRKLGLPADAPRENRKPPKPNLLELSRALTVALSTGTLLPPWQVHTLATDMNVLADAHLYGVETVAACLIRSGMTPSELRWRYG